MLHVLGATGNRWDNEQQKTKKKKKHGMCHRLGDDERCCCLVLPESDQYLIMITKCTATTFTVTKHPTETETTTTNSQNNNHVGDNKHALAHHKKIANKRAWPTPEHAACCGVVWCGVVWYAGYVRPSTSPGEVPLARLAARTAASPASRVSQVLWDPSRPASTPDDQNMHTICQQHICFVRHVTSALKAFSGFHRVQTSTFDEQMMRVPPRYIEVFFVHHSSSALTAFLPSKYRSYLQSDPWSRRHASILRNPKRSLFNYIFF